MFHHIIDSGGCVPLEGATPSNIYDHNSTHANQCVYCDVISQALTHILQLPKKVWLIYVPCTCKCMYAYASIKHYAGTYRHLYVANKPAHAVSTIIKMNTLAFVNFLLIKIFHHQNFVPHGMYHGTNLELILC